MTYEVYRYIFIIGAILAGIMLVLSVILFLVLKIPKTIGDLTGSNARKAISSIRNRNDKNEKAANEEDRYTRDISGGVNNNSFTGTNNYGNLGHSSNKSNETSVLGEADTFAAQTTVLNNENETTVLNQFSANMNATVSLDETTILGDASVPKVEIEYEITYIHTDEVIY